LSFIEERGLAFDEESLMWHHYGNNYIKPVPISGLDHLEFIMPSKQAYP
jgi:hypothetical protein